MKLIKNTIYNLAGLGLPLLVAVFCIPVLIRELGDARFGLLTLIWAVVSYFGLFDLGLGRALTQLLAVAIVEKDEKRAGSLVATATALMAVLGIFAGILMALLASWGVGLIQSVPDRQEAINAVLWMSLAMPFIVLTSGFRGVLEARQAFGIVNAIRLPMGLFTFIGPVLVVVYGSAKLDAIACILSVGRIVACVFHAWYALNSLRKGCGKLLFQRMLLKPLCISGGWLTLSNIISPLMGYVDRFIIGGVISAAAVAYYTTPQEIVTKLWVVPGAMTAVLFPAFATNFKKQDEQNKLIFAKAVHWLFLMIFPMTLILAVFAREILTIWIGAEFAVQSTVLMQIFCIGILINCLAHVPFTLIQGAGQPRITAIIHSIELPLFLVILWGLTLKFGVLGAALAWILRMVADTLIMFIVCNHLQGWSKKMLVGSDVFAYVLLASLGFLGVFWGDLVWRAVWILTVIVITALVYVVRNQKMYIQKSE